MKHAKTLSIICSLLFLFALACSATGGGGGDTAPTQGPNLAGTQSALQATQDALAQPTAAVPTDAPENTDPPSDTGTGTSPDFYTEEFDVVPGDWSYVTYEGAENPNAGTDFDIYVDGGQLVFDIPDTYVWPYYGPDSWIYTDVRLDMRAENLGNNNNNVSLWCRYNDRGWYEANVANNGLYWIFRYDAGTDEFVQLYSGGVANLKTGKDTNDFTLICEGDELTLGVNGVEIRTVQDSTFDEGLVGIGVSSFDATPVLVEVDYVQISQP